MWKRYIFGSLKYLSSFLRILLLSLGWQLMSHCLSAFAPTKLLYKYLLKYVSDHGYQGYKWVCQQKLLKSGAQDFAASRNYPPSVLEWRANKKRVSMTLAGMILFLTWPSSGEPRSGTRS